MEVFDGVGYSVVGEVFSLDGLVVWLWLIEGVAFIVFVFFCVIVSLWVGFTKGCKLDDVVC